MRKNCSDSLGLIDPGSSRTDLGCCSLGFHLDSGLLRILDRGRRGSAAGGNPGSGSCEHVVEAAACVAAACYAARCFQRKGSALLLLGGRPPTKNVVVCFWHHLLESMLLLEEYESDD